VSHIDLETVTAADGRDLLAAAQTDWSRPVPHCPDWDAAGLVGHTGAILAWVARIITTGERVSRRDRETPPAGHAELAAWYSAHLDRTVDVLTTTPADTPAWTFSSIGDHRAGWWRRRLAVELAIHRWDAQHAAGAVPSPLDGAVAAAGIGEFLAEFLPGLLARPGVTGLAGLLHLHATDASAHAADAQRAADWRVDLGAGGQGVSGERDTQAGAAVPGTRISGTTSDLLLWLANRGPLPGISLEGDQSRAVALAWPQLSR
jgi:uncharacterized protein (TIGR03083 family)